MDMEMGSDFPLFSLHFSAEHLNSQGQERLYFKGN